jgi:hypothetical protein
MHPVTLRENHLPQEKSCILSTNLQDLWAITRLILIYQDEATHSGA